MTDRQREIWNFLVEYVDQHGYPPTVREIAERVGLASPSTVHAHLANLERAGLLRRDPTKPRALELIGRQRREPQTVQEDGARMYGLELQALCDVADVAADGVVPTLALREIAARMTGDQPTSLSVYRARKETA